MEYVSLVLELEEWCASNNQDSVALCWDCWRVENRMSICVFFALDRNVLECFAVGSAGMNWHGCGRRGVRFELGVDDMDHQSA